MQNTTAIIIDGDELISKLQDDLQAMGYRVTGQAIRADGAPIIYVSEVEHESE